MKLLDLPNSAPGSHPTLIAKCGVSIDTDKSGFKLDDQMNDMNTLQDHEYATHAHSTVQLQGLHNQRDNTELQYTTVNAALSYSIKTMHDR